MRAVLLAAVGLVVGGSVWAQNAPIQSNPLPPLQQQWLKEGSPPVQEAPVSPDGQSPGVPGQDQAPSPVVARQPIQRPNVWVPASGVRLDALDKVNAQATALNIKIGQSATFGSLTITLKACVIRPADQPADSAAYLTVKDSHPDSPDFNGWMLADEPSVSMMQNPVYDLRVSGCT